MGSFSIYLSRFETHRSIRKHGRFQRMVLHFRANTIPEWDGRNREPVQGLHLYCRIIVQWILKIIMIQKKRRLPSTILAITQWEMQANA